ncbi:neutral zinc metallopeptidase [Planococcus shixiaomingii]|uniref:neutral zinc metallopeptidase n=1 Tax=Planococcus shixiaomingii TaxID=3058393 RepID=UPI00262E8A9F|nr:neutral zinc metallopeptidase [Planococcus sp. N022]WKA54467.1 neutral zinc metallopeptidase [Planococcus sp. N022]
MEATLKKGEIIVFNLPGNILITILMVLVLGACGPEQETSTAGNEEPSGELKMIELPKAPAAEPGETVTYGFTADKSSGAMTSYLELLINNVHSLWAELMVQGGHNMPVVDYSLPYAGETEATSCIGTGSTGPDDAFYCAEDDAIVFANELAMKIWESEVESNADPAAGAETGNFAVAAAMAHLYAHSLQAEWGWLPVQADEERLVPVKRTELNADCLTGVWAHSAYDKESLESSVVEKAMESLSGAGQFDLIDDEDHGTPAERTAAFMAGFDSGMANSCDPYVVGDDAPEQ